MDMEIDQPMDDQENKCDNIVLNITDVGLDTDRMDDENCNIMVKKDYSNQTIQSKFLSLPWNDVLFTQILDTLSLAELYRLRAVSKPMMELVHNYLSSMFVLDLSKVFKRFKNHTFAVLVAHCFNLRVLNLFRCKWLSADLLQEIIEQNPHLIRLNIAHCLSVNNKCLQRLAVNCKKIRSIQLQNCLWTNSIAVTCLAINCPELEEVDLTSCWEVTDDAAIELIVRCQNLKIFSLCNIYGITDNVLVMISGYSKKLEVLNISGCWRITDDGVNLIAANCLNLKKLFVSGCRQVSELSLAKLRENGIELDVEPPSAYPEIMRWRDWVI